MKRICNKSNQRLVAVLVGFAVTLGLAAATAEAQSGRSAEIRRLLDGSGMDAMIEEFAIAARNQMPHREDQPDDVERQHVLEIYEAVFAPERFREQVIDAVMRDYDPVHVAGVARWFNSDMGAKFRDELLYAQSAEATEELLKFAEASQKQAPNPERVEIAIRINTARGASALSKRLVEEMLRGMVNGTAALSSVDGRIPTQAELDATVEAQVGDLGPLLEQQMVASFLFIGRNLSIANNRAYLAHLESDAGKWFYTRTADGFVDSMVQAGNAFAIHTTAWSQDATAEASENWNAKEFAAAGEAGGAFASSNTQSACIDEAYLQRKACTDLLCVGKVKRFTAACLSTAEPDASLCSDVPGTGDLATTIYWRADRCSARGTSDPNCNAVAGSLQEHCAAKLAGN